MAQKSAGKSKKKKDSQRMSRLLLLLFAVFACFAALWINIAHIKRVHGREYEQAAQEQQTEVTDSLVKALRGGIYDSAGEPLAVSVRVYDLIIDSQVLYNAEKKIQDATVKALCECIEGADENEIRDCFSEKYKDWRYLKTDMGEGLSQSIRDRLQALLDDGTITGIWFEETEARSYPNGTLAAHVLGFNGVYGLEQYYADYLRGTDGRKMTVADENGAYTSEYIEAMNGYNLNLTLNSSVQFYMEQILEEYLNKYECLDGCAICMNPKTGAVYGMCGFPTFDPNDPYQISGLTKQYEATFSPKDPDYYTRIWNNYALTHTYQPGSTYKPIFASIALEESVIGTGTVFNCVKSGYTVYDQRLLCYAGHVHGVQTVAEVLMNSCNQGMAQISTMMSGWTFLKYQDMFGFGHRTGIDLAGEVDAAGLIYSADDLGPVELATSSYGQGGNATPIQLITAFSALVNGGYYVQPYVVDSVTDSAGNVVLDNSRTVLRRVLSEKTSETMKELLEGVVTGYFGKNYEIPGYTFGGKTGTADQSDGSVTVSFMSVCPAEDPEVILLVILDRDNDDSSYHAAMVSKAIMTKILPVLGIYPSK